MEDESKPKSIQPPESCVFLVNPWKKRTIFTTLNSPGSHTMTYPMPSNSDAGLFSRPQLRLVRLSSVPHFIGPPQFPNSHPLNGFTRLHNVSEQLLDGINLQRESMPHEQQWDLQNNLVLNQDTFSTSSPISQKNVVLNQDTFPPTPSPTSIESNNEEMTWTNNHQRNQDIIATECQQTDSLDANAVIFDPQNSENMNASVSSSDELILPIANEVVYEIQTDSNIGKVISEKEISNGKQITMENEETTTFNNVEEAVTSTSLANESSTLSSQFTIPKSSAISSLQADMTEKLGMSVTVTDDKQEEVVKAAKSLFSKRTRTLYHWLYPDTSKNKLKATVSAAWDTLPDNEKHFYISQVLGRFGLQASSLMINPQLGGINGLHTDLLSKCLNSSSRDTAAETQRAVDDLFASCDDADNWASYPKPKRRNSTERRRKRKSSRTNYESGGRARLGAMDPDELDEETAILKRMREENLENEFEEDAELTSELEKFRLISQNAKDNDDFWSKIPDPDDIFPQMDF